MSGPGPEGGVDLGSGVYMRWLSFSPDRDLNPHLAEYPDDDRTGLIIGHVHDDGEVCEGAVLFDTPVNRRNSDRPVWQVESWEPLTVSPSILRMDGCGLHGYIREGRWVGV